MDSLTLRQRAVEKGHNLLAMLFGMNPPHSHIFHAWLVPERFYVQYLVMP